MHKCIAIQSSHNFVLADAKFEFMKCCDDVKCMNVSVRGVCSYTVHPRLSEPLWFIGSKFCSNN